MAIYTRDTLLAALAEGETFSYLFFWGHRPLPDGGVGPSCFSQWFAAGFELEGVYYPTAEHFMMAEKARLFGDRGMAERILHAPTPKAAKDLGRKVQGFDLAIWSARSTEIVVRGNREKFSQNPRLGDFLRATAPQVLVEASPDDAIWGIGLHRDDPRATEPYEWQGMNLLGFALMQVRDMLAAR